MGEMDAAKDTSEKDAVVIDAVVMDVSAVDARIAAAIDAMAVVQELHASKVAKPTAEAVDTPTIDRAGERAAESGEFIDSEETTPTGAVISYVTRKKTASAWASL